MASELKDQLPDFAIEELEKARNAVIHRLGEGTAILIFMKVAYRMGYRYGYSVGKAENEPRQPDGY